MWLVPALGGAAVAAAATLLLDRRAGLAVRLAGLFAGQGPLPGLPPVVRAGDLAPPLRTAYLPVRGSSGPDVDATRGLAQLVDAIAAPIMILDRGFSIRAANAPVHMLLGDAAGAVLRHPALRAAAETLSATSVAEVEIALDVPVQRRLRASLMQLPAPHAGLLSVVLDDRTQNVALDRMRADFVANASHELRTPLAALIGFIDTLRGPAADDPAAQRRFLEIMSGQAQRMRRLIDNLMSLSRAQLIEHERPRGSVDVAALTERVAAELRPLLTAAGQSLRLDLQAELPMVAADADQIAQVIANLLDNAAKYANQGAEVVVSVSVAPSGRSGLDDPLWSAMPGVVISVVDDGPGIAARHLPRLTERFYRVDEAHSAKSGSGLGLAIVKHIVGRHRGKLSIESPPGGGAAFHVWLPVPTAIGPGK